MFGFANSLITGVLALAVVLLPGSLCWCAHAEAATPVVAADMADHACCSMSQDEQPEPSTPESPDCPHCAKTTVLGTDCSSATPTVVKSSDVSAWPAVTLTQPARVSWMAQPERPRQLHRAESPPQPRSEATLRALRCLLLT